MMNRILTLGVLALAMGFALGCGGESEPAASDATLESSAEDFKAEAEKTITEENMESKLDEVEKQVEEDAASLEQ